MFIKVQGGFFEDLKVKFGIVGCSVRVLEVLSQAPKSCHKTQQSSKQYLDSKLHVHSGFPRLPKLDLSSLPKTTRNNCTFRKEQVFMRCFQLTDSLGVSCTVW